MMKKPLKPMPKRILHLTLTAHWFAEVSSGRKTEEFREIKPYWERRLFPLNKESGGKFFRQFDEVYFRLGYRTLAPFMRVEWKGCRIVTIPKAITEGGGVRFEDGKKLFAISLGKVLERRNFVDTGVGLPYSQR